MLLMLDYQNALILRTSPFFISPLLHVFIQARVHGGPQQSHSGAALVALRDIAIGEELLENYLLDYKEEDQFWNWFKRRMGLNIEADWFDNKKP